MNRLVEIGRFDNPVDAHMLLDVLMDAGIDARIFDELTGSVLPQVGAIGVRVVVRAEDAARAAAAIAEEKARPRGPHADASDEIPWRLAEGGGSADAFAGADEAENDGGVGADADDSPEVAQALPGTEAADVVPGGEAEAVAWATRTRSFAFIGVACFLFSFGAIFRAMDPPPDVEAYPVARRRLRQARILAGCTILFWAFVAASIWFVSLTGIGR